MCKSCIYPISIENEYKGEGKIHRRIWFPSLWRIVEIWESGENWPGHLRVSLIENFHLILGYTSGKTIVSRFSWSFCREVFKARDKNCTKKFVAMKKVLMDNEKEGVCIRSNVFDCLMYIFLFVYFVHFYECIKYSSA